MSAFSFGVEDPYARLDLQITTLIANGQYKEAVPLAEKLLPLAEKQFGADHPNTEKALNQLSEACRGTIDAAQREGREDIALAETLTKLARVHQLQGKPLEAEPLYRRALAILEIAEKPDSPLFAQTLNNLALLYLAQARSDEANTLFRQALVAYEQTQGADSKDAGLTWINIGAAYRDQGKITEAETSFKKALKILEKRLGQSDPNLVPALNNYSGLYFAQGKFAEAEPLVLRALKIAEKNYGLKPHPDLLTTLDNLEWIYAKMGRTEELTKLQEKSKLARFGPEESTPQE